MDLSMLYFFEVIGHLPFPLNFIVTACFLLGAAVELFPKPGSKVNHR